MKVIKETFIWIAAIGLLPGIFNIIRLLNDGTELKPANVLGGMFGSVLITLIVSYSVLGTLFWIDNKLSWEKHAVKRIIVELICTNIVVIFLMIVIATIFFNITPDINITYNKLIFTNVITGMVMNLIITGAFEGSYIFKRWKESMIKAEKLEREYLQSKYDILKQQLNPHFLFNSLNVLSSLVHTDAKKAEFFIEEFAKVYRYILDKASENIVKLQEEIELVNSYFSLQKIRFSDGISMIININNEAKEKYIPTLALQLLIENSIKHNAVSDANPLQIDVYVENEYLFVKNKILLRLEKINSTGKGLENLKERYSLLCNLKPYFSVVDGFFVAKIPLLEKSGL